MEERMIGKDEYEEMKRLFVIMWTERGGVTIDRKDRNMIVSVGCPACLVAESILNSCRSLRNMFDDDDVIICDLCPIDFSYMGEAFEKAKESGDEMCGVEGSRRVEYLYEPMTKEGKEIAIKIASDPKWRSYEDMVKEVEKVKKRAEKAEKR